MKLLSTLILLLWAVPSMAEVNPPSYNKVHFSVVKEQTFINDELNVTLTIKKEHKKSSEVARMINTIMAEAFKSAKKYSNVKVKTGNYSINPVHSQERYQDRKIVRWSGQQTLKLKSTDIKAVTELMQKLQSTLQVKSTQFSVSDSARKKAEDQMVQGALEQFKARASAMTEALGAESYKIVSLNITTPKNKPSRPVYKRMMKMAADMPAPTLVGGNDSLAVSISATVELQF